MRQTPNRSVIKLKLETETFRDLYTSAFYAPGTTGCLLSVFLREYTFETQENFR